MVSRLRATSPKVIRVLGDQGQPILRLGEAESCRRGGDTPESAPRRWMPRPSSAMGSKARRPAIRVVVLRRDTRCPEMENEILRQAAAYFAESSRKSMYPRIRDLAVDRIPSR